MRDNYIKIAIIVFTLGLLVGILIFTTHVFADDISCTPTISPLPIDIASPSATIYLTPVLTPTTIHATPTAGDSAKQISQPNLPPDTGYML